MKVVKETVRIALAALLLAGAAGVWARAQSTAAGARGAGGGKAVAQEPTPEEIIKQFTEKETEFYKAWMNYTYRQTANIRIRSKDGRPSNEWMDLVSEVVFDDDGSRDVRQLKRRGQLKSLRFTREDEEIINNLNPFALTTAELPLYDLKYEGKERVDELNCHVFAVKPKKIKSGRLYFEGRIWVDDLDLQVVRTVGKAVPQSPSGQLFPEFETLRQMIDGKYWFPVWTHADERLRFVDSTVRIEETITYDDYRKFDTKATIRYGDLEGEGEE
ncbi:MAG: hypothetical protein LBT74_02090 [Acidobacteriota bacterium]|nr:hypothetical protein [Acidobacteriota bacterium]